MFVPKISVFHKQVRFDIIIILISHNKYFTYGLMIYECITNTMEILHPKNSGVKKY